MSDHNERYERWLAVIAEHLTQHGIAAVLGYDDRHLGDMMYMSIQTGAGYVELVVWRGKHGRALLTVFADSQDAARAVVAALGSLHRRIPRTRNAKRKFVHMVERLVERVGENFQSYMEQYPHPALERLREIAPDAQPMVGAVAYRRVKPPKGDTQGRYGASVALANGTRRGLRYNAGRGAFEAFGDLLAELSLRIEKAGPRAHPDGHPDLPWGAMAAAPIVIGGVGGAALAAYAAAGGEEEQKQSEADDSDTAFFEVADTTCTILDCGIDLVDAVTCPQCNTGLEDLGGCDTPDCDASFVPDCSFGCDL